MAEAGMSSDAGPAVSVIIRTLNEARWLDALIVGIREQDFEGGVEIIIVDSGSTDGGLDIVQNRQCRLVTIDREEFTFGRSLNRGCFAARGEILVFVSGHCLPADRQWLARLTAPLRAGEADYVYGRQIGGEITRFSEHRLFQKYFPADPAGAQGGYFCNNANAALLTRVWREFPFDEELTGLEDLDLGKRLIAAKRKVRYVGDAVVHHFHDETWTQVRRRYEREAIALQQIAPELHISFVDFLRFVTTAVLLDARAAWRRGVLLKNIGPIIMFRAMQFHGSYRGNRLHRVLSRRAKERYFFPAARRPTGDGAGD
jgi:glycosyltransferase involved in cell wall biosynthesis